MMGELHHGFQSAPLREHGLGICGSLSMPDSVSIAVAIKCNSNSAMCNRVGLDDPGKEMSQELVNKFAQRENMPFLTYLENGGFEVEKYQTF